MIVEIPDDNSNIKDLISREDLIRAIKTECNPYGAPTIDYESGLRVLEIIERAPTVVQPQGEWTPVTERLPHDRDWYLGVFREPDTGFIGLPYICDYIGVVTKGTTKEGWILRGFTDIDNAEDYIKSLECVAWQPLPEPYKRGNKE